MKKEQKKRQRLTIRELRSLRFQIVLHGKGPKKLYDVTLYDLVILHRARLFTPVNVCYEPGESLGLQLVAS